MTSIAFKSPATATALQICKKLLSIKIKFYIHVLKIKVGIIQAGIIALFSFEVYR